MHLTSSMRQFCRVGRVCALFCLILLIPLLCLTLTLDSSAEAAGVVFLRDGGTGDGLSADSPVGSIADAYSLLGDEGGVIVISGTYTMTGPFYAPAHSGRITLTQVYGTDDYRDEGSFYTGGEGRRYTLGGDTLFENMRFTTKNKAGLIIMAHYNPVELGEGVECVGFDGSLTSSALTLLGGRNTGVTPVRAPAGGTHITVRSGSGILIAGVDRQVDEKNTRVAYINIYGVEICNLYGGNINKGTSRGSVINIYGGRFSGKVQFGLNQWEYTKVNITGGDFSAVAKIEGLAPYSELTVSSELYREIKDKLYSFTQILVSTGNIDDPVTGDINGDGFLSNSDITLLVRALAGLSAIEDSYDINGDGRVNNRDCICTIQLSAGWMRIDEFGELEGDGTEEHPYLIQDRDDLAYLRDRVLGYADTRGVCFLQTADITLDSSVSWTPIGTIGVPFEGSYDGDGHKIDGLYISTSRSYAGVFGYITGTVTSLDVYGEITVHLDAAYSHSYAGGIAGGMNNGALIRDCNSYVKITGDSYVGGIVGGVHYVDDRVTTEVSRIVRCTFRGELLADGKYSKNESASYFGGIVGYVHGAVESCENYGNITVTGTNCRYIGGIAGFAYYSEKFGIPSEDEGIRIYDCRNYGDVTGHRETGGIVGAGALPIVECENDGAITGVRCVGGIVGVAGTSATADDGYGYTELCINRGAVTLTQQYGGGIAGYSYFDIIGCKSTGKVQGGTSKTGNISGHMEGGVIS